MKERQVSCVYAGYLFPLDVFVSKEKIRWIKMKNIRGFCRIHTFNSTKKE